MIVPTGRMRVGLVYETLDAYLRQPGDPHDFAVEYEPESTVTLLENALRLLGHLPERIGTPHQLLERLGQEPRLALDAAVCIAEGFGSRNREAWAPVLLEMAGIPHLGSDALTLSLSLDKAWTNRMVAAAGIRIAEQCWIGADALARDDWDSLLPAAFPLFVKPRWEGTSKGIAATSRVEDIAQLKREVARIVADYRQPALVESFLAGAEFTVTVVGNSPARALPALQRGLDADTRIGLHAIEGVHEELRQGSENPSAEEAAYCLPGALDAALERELQEMALAVYAQLECLDFARADFRLDAQGHPVFLEINPLPTFAADGSFGILAELEGRSVEELVAEVLNAGLERLALS